MRCCPEGYKNQEGFFISTTKPTKGCIICIDFDCVCNECMKNIEEAL